MPKANSGAQAADLNQLFNFKITGRALNTLGVVMLALAIASFACASGMSPMVRLTSGLAVAAAMVAGGHVFSRFGPQAFWFGSMLIGSGYGLSYFFANASYYVAGLPVMESPYPCWAISIAAAALVCVHTNKNNILCLAGLAFTFLVSASVLMQSLASDEVVHVAGLAVRVSAVGSVAGMLWWSALSVIYRHFENKTQSGSATGTSSFGARRLANRVAHELCFIAAAINALALPAYCGGLEHAPLWWSIEVPVLLAICFRSGEFFKHALVMIIWFVSAALVFIVGPQKLDVLVSMAVPVAGSIMALAYRYLQSSMPQWQKVTGYCLYLYGSLVTALALTVVHLGPWEALPYWLVASGVILSLSLACRDRILQGIGLLLALWALVLFGARWQHWNENIWLPIIVVAGCYGFSVAWGYIKNKGGWATSPFTVFQGAFTLTAKEAGILEFAAAVFGYAALIAGSYLLIDSPFNTVAWGVEAFALIAFGFLTGRRGHRFSGLVALFLASGKLSIFDLSGVGGGWRIVASLGAVGVCFVAAGIFYLVEYGRKSKGTPTK